MQQFIYNQKYLQFIAVFFTCELGYSMVPVCQSIPGIGQQISFIVERRKSGFGDSVGAQLMIGAGYLMVRSDGRDFFFKAFPVMLVLDVFFGVGSLDSFGGGLLLTVRH